MENKVIKCSKCNAENIKKDGKRKTENRGLIQRYKCLDCGLRFVVDDGFFRMRNNPQKITCAIDLFYRGVSTRKIQGHFKAFMPHNSHFSSIYRWIIRYSKMMGKFTDKLKLDVGEEMQIDEIEYKRRLSHEASKGMTNNWFIDSMDTTSRFMLSSEFAESRGGVEIKRVIGMAKQKAGNQIRVCTTDGFNAYEEAVKKVFGYNNKLGQYNVIHNKVNASKGEGFNVKIERLHNSIRERTKIMRGFHGSVESAKAIMQGYEVFYNFIRQHQAINQTPSDVAIPQLKFNTENRWLELIEMSNQNRKL